MKLSIVTINYNNAAGLKKTLESVASQQLNGDIELEHIIVDGASTDGSVEIAKDYQKEVKVLYTEGRASKAGASVKVRVSVKVISELDTGIYNAMNKGIRMATGDYIQILNSGDILYSDTVVQRMYEALVKSELPEILYGNMVKDLPGRKRTKDTGLAAQRNWTMMDFYVGTMNHDCAWIKRTLFVNPNINANPNLNPNRYTFQSSIINQQLTFRCFGLYDEEMRICSDWKWYLNTIILGIGTNGERIEPVKPVYVDIDVTLFDMNGISESGGKNSDIIRKERRDYLEKVLPAHVLADYDRYTFQTLQMERFKRHHLYGIVYFFERVLFKLEKWGILKR